MANLNTTIIKESQDGNEHLPLDNFFAVLKENGFSVTPLQIIQANRIIMQYAGWVSSENTLYMYLAPVFAGNEDEQRLFKKLFNKHFKPSPPPPEQQQKTGPSLEKKLRQHWKEFLALYIFIALIAVLVILKTLVRQVHFDPTKIEIILKEKNDTSLAAEDKKLFLVKTNDRLELVSFCRYPQQAGLETEALYNWGDGTDRGALPSHIYTKPGRYAVTVYVNVLYKSSSIKKDTLYRNVNVCSSDNIVGIQLPARIDAILVGQKFSARAIITGSEKPIAINWLLDGRPTGKGKNISLSFKKAGKHYIICQGIYDSINSPCTIEGYAEFVIHGAADFIKKPTQPTGTFNKPAADRPTYNKERIPLLAALYKKLGLAFFVVTIFFIALWLKELKKTGRIKSRALDKYKKLIASFAKTPASAVLPFTNRNYIPAQQPEMAHISRQLRRRVKDTVSFMHVQKTINKAIERNGFFEPIHEARTRPAEYLVLIDESEPGSQLLKLFEYLVGLLKQNNVLVEKFYYKKQPGFCYNIFEPNGISLEKLYVKYQRSILLILGNGYQLIDSSTASPVERLAVILNQWQHKAIVTPVSFIDWQQKEKQVLLPLLPIVPVDIEGLVLLAEILSGKDNAVDIIGRLTSNQGVFYSTAAIDFYSLEALEQYCNVPGWTKINADGETINVLMEWVAALAIYPKLRWEIVLAIGNAILDKYDLKPQLNFRILLRLARVSWMNDGFIRDELRFQLLKKLSLENEKLARETILTILNDVPQKEIATTGNTEEKEVQQIINEFSLYANDPVYYAAYSDSTYLFEKLWQDNLLNDAATTAYLKNNNRQWQTLVNQRNEKTNVAYSSSVDEYLQSKEKEETLLSKVYLAFSIISAAVLITSIAALRVLYIWDKVL